MFHRQRTSHRLFFALKPPPLLARQVANAAPWVDAVEAVQADRLHVTLFILDDMASVPDRLLAAMARMGDQLRAAAVTMTLDRVVGGRTSVALRSSHMIEPLDALRGGLVELARAELVAERKAYRFSPHMTLGYRRGEPFQERITPIGWRADELILIHSLVGRTRHEVVGRWTLSAAAAGAGARQSQLELL